MNQGTDWKNEIKRLESILQTTAYEASPREHLQTLIALGDAYCKLPEKSLKGKSDNLKKAIGHYQDAKDFSRFPFPLWQQASRKLKDAEKELEGITRGTQTTGPLGRPPQPNTGFMASPKTSALLFLILVIEAAIFGVTHILVPPHYQCVTGNITINGSTALFPLLEQAKNAYQQRCPAAVISINPPQLPSGSANGLNQVFSRNPDELQVDIAASDVYADPAEADLVDHQVAVTVFALVVNSKVTQATGITNLTSDQIEEIYSGSVNDWYEVKSESPQANAQSLPIIRVSRPLSSETRQTFEQYVLGDTENAPGPSSLSSDDAKVVADNICNNQGAIGYIPLFYSYTHRSCLHILSVNSVDPQNVNMIKNNTYQFWNLEHLYTKGPADGLAQAFIDYMYSDTVKGYISQYDQYGYLSTDTLAPDLLASH